MIQYTISHFLEKGDSIMQKGYQTKTKQSIIEYFMEHSNQTATVEDVCQYLKSENLQVNQSTVYRCLDRLLEQNLIIKYISDDGKKAIFQFAGHSQSCQHHLHLKCTKCGKVIHLDCDFMDEIKTHVQQNHEFYIQCDSSIIFGLCKECQEKKEN